MKISTICDIMNHNYIYYIKEINYISTNKYVKEENGLLNGVEIDDMLPASTHNK